MHNSTEDTLTAGVLSRIATGTDPRLRQIMSSLIGHLHAFVRDVELTEAEWAAGIQFLTEVGHLCDDRRQEFILLSDTLGVSMLVDAIQHRAAAGATESTVFGPFHRDNAPEVEWGGSITKGDRGEPCVVSGRVLDRDGQPIPGAALDVWQVAPNGLYDSQDPTLAEMDLRGRLRADAAGNYRFRTVMPVSYSIPDDGPVGRLLHALGRHAWRPAHIHFIVSAPGYVPVTTHVFAAGDPYLDSDAVFGVKESLVTQFERHDSAEAAAAQGVTAPFYTAHYDFGLASTR